MIIFLEIQLSTGEPVTVYVEGTRAPGGLDELRFAPSPDAAPVRWRSEVARVWEQAEEPPVGAVRATVHRRR